MKPIILALLLAGCVQLAPNAYEYFEDGHGKTDFYRWTVVAREDFPHRCGFLAPSAWNGGGACAIRLQQAVVQPGDRSIYTRIAVKQAKEGRLCIVYATMSENEAKRMLDKYQERDLWSHEVVMHCQLGLNHREVRK